MKKYHHSPKEAFLEIVTPYTSILALISLAQGSPPAPHIHSFCKHGLLTAIEV